MQLEKKLCHGALVTSNCNAETSTAFLRQLRDQHTEPLIVIWDNSPAHRGPEIRVITSYSIHYTKLYDSVKG